MMPWQQMRALCVQHQNRDRGTYNVAVNRYFGPDQFIHSRYDAPNLPKVGGAGEKRYSFGIDSEHNLLHARHASSGTVHATANIRPYNERIVLSRDEERTNRDLEYSFIEARKGDLETVSIIAVTSEVGRVFQAESSDICTKGLTGSYLKLIRAYFINRFGLMPDTYG